ncbi:MAG: hypothetical protein R2705_02810 [Ilumatobacteraceae bacterium]
MLTAQGTAQAGLVTARGVLSAVKATITAPPGDVDPRIIALFTARHRDRRAPDSQRPSSIFTDGRRPRRRRDDTGERCARWRDLGRALRDSLKRRSPQRAEGGCRSTCRSSSDTAPAPTGDRLRRPVGGGEATRVDLLAGI